VAQSASPLSHSQPVSFPEWNDVLSRSPLAPEVKRAHAHAICSFLRHCKTEHAPATIRTVQDLLGHASVETTQIYTHVMQKPGLGIRSPLDALSTSA